MGKPVTRGKITLRAEQAEAYKKLHKGCILVGDVGSGKTFTSIFWALREREGTNKHIYVITTANKRDLIEPGKDKPDWQGSLEACGCKENDYTVDSWNNIKKYTKVKDSIFIFDEQRVVGYGTWGRSFIQIAGKNNNQWILLSATPADDWKDYMTTFIANGFYRNKTDFYKQHVVENPNTPFPQIMYYVGTAVLERNRRYIEVLMDDVRETERMQYSIECEYDHEQYLVVARDRWNFETGFPIQNASEFTQLLRKVVSISYDRQSKALTWLATHKTGIIFYNYDYELEILRELAREAGKLIGEWNGHKHERIPELKDCGSHYDGWVYLVQYTAGAEGWNCVTTDSMLFYSPNYSYRKMEQAMGRIDRLNTKYKKLEYTTLISDSKIDKAVMKAIKNKKKFNEQRFFQAQKGSRRP